MLVLCCVLESKFSYAYVFFTKKNENYTMGQISERTEAFLHERIERVSSKRKKSESKRAVFWFLTVHYSLGIHAIHRVHSIRTLFLLSLKRLQQHK